MHTRMKNHFKNSEHANGAHKQYKHWVTHQQLTAQQISVQNVCLFYLHGTINQIPFVKLSVWYLKKQQRQRQQQQNIHIAKSLFHAYKTAYTTMV